jgi:hypothetical protein
MNNAQMMGIKSEISKSEDTLKEYQLYKKFLEALTPKVQALVIVYRVPKNLYVTEIQCYKSIYNTI